MEFDSVKTGSLLNQPEKKKKKDTLNLLVVSDHLTCQQLIFYLLVLFHL